MSLIDSNNFITVNYVSSNAFTYLFRYVNGLLSAENLILPATILSNYCYDGMFQSCTSLIKAPELPATTLANSCYRQMFYGCSSLNYIKCLATDISATSCTYNWVDLVASAGTFVKNPNMSSWTSGQDGIPTGWTVQNA